MDKFQVAHEYIINHLHDTDLSYQAKVNQGWLYADSMQAEADKRKEKGFPESIKSEKLVINQDQYIKIIH